MCDRFLGGMRASVVCDPVLPVLLLPFCDVTRCR